MPFAVFRQHQRKLLAVFAIMAMIGFVLSDTLPRWMNSGGVSDKDLQVAELYGKKIHLSDLAAMSQKRQRANRFMYYAGKFGDPNYFGGTSRAEMIDALILERQADRLNMPGNAAFARDWVDRETNGAMTAPLFETILGRFEQKIGGEQLLIDIASQVRIRLAAQEIAVPVVTPLDVFRNYRDQTERASFKVVPVLVESFTGKVAEPTDAEVLAFYEKRKDNLPDPASPEAGFKVPRQVKAESLVADLNAVAKRIKDKLTDDELKSYYEGRKAEFRMDTELPVDLFAGAPELTPARYLPLAELRDTLSEALARDRGNEEVQDTFATIHDQVIDKFADAYHKVEDDIADAKKDGASTDSLVLPKPDDLSGVARKYGLAYEATPMMDRAEAEHAGRISSAKSGTGQSADSKSFAAAIFDPKNLLYEGFELGDFLGNRYLVRKVADVPAHVAELAEIRDQVVRAWKREKARPLARKAAEDLAARVKSAGGQIGESTIDNRPVTAIDSVTKLKPGMPVPSQVNGQFQFRRGAATPTELPEVPQAGQPLIDALFALKAGEVAVEPDQPQSTFYVLTLDKRTPVSFLALMGPNGSLASYKSETEMDVLRKAYGEGMARLREQAGYHPENYPSEDRSRDEDASS